MNTKFLRLFLLYARSIQGNIQHISGNFVRRLYRVTVYIPCCAGAGVPKPPGDRLDIGSARNQQRGVCVT